MTNLSTKYLGLKLKNPLVASASPLCKEIGNIRKMEDCGASAVVLHSLFEEQINIESNELDRMLWDSSSTSAEANDYFPDLGNYSIGPDGYLDHIRKAKAAVKIPIITSLNGVAKGGWIRYAKDMEQDDRDRVELNIYFVPTDQTMTSTDIEKDYVELVKEVKASVKDPGGVKIG